VGRTRVAGMRSDTPPMPPERLCDVRSVEALRVSAVAAPGALLVRAGIVDRLMVAQSLVPRAVRLLVVAGHHGWVAGTPCPRTGAHRTGGAVDLMAYVDGEPPGWREVADALTAVGMVPGTRWWHWSFGDLDWCHTTDAATPLYRTVHRP
jgi:zinc D-Ala-D-Ala dipeptidase